MSHYRGKIFVLDMGEPVKIVDLAQQMIRLAGLIPNKDIDIAFTGSRPGEKLFEEIFTIEPLASTDFPGLLIACHRPVHAESVRSFLSGIEAGYSIQWLLGALRHLIPEYVASLPQGKDVQEKAAKKELRPLVLQ